MSPIHPAWLPQTALAPLGRLVVRLTGDGALVETIATELRRATAAHGGRLVRGTPRGADPEPDVTFTSSTAAGDRADLGAEGFRVVRHRERLTVTAATGDGLLQGFFHVVRLGHDPHRGEDVAVVHRPAHPLRMLDHWDNVESHPVMGQVERGYAGGSLFYADGSVREDLSRVGEYARLLASVGVNRVAINNVNVHRTESRLLTDGLPDVARIAAQFRPWRIRVHLSVNFNSPVALGGLATSDPLAPAVQQWWRDAAARVYQEIPDFGGFVVKADSEGQPGPFGYGRDHADGANLLARAVAPHGGVVFWRAFVYNHTQDWRDRSTDRARAAYDHFAGLDGRFDDNVVVQVKNGPIDFQPREPVSPLFAAMPRTSLAVELQVTQEYTGQQRHAVYLGPQWGEVLQFPLTPRASVSGLVSGVVGVSNVGDDPFWTGHPLAQANLYAFGRLAWEPALDPTAVLQEWIVLTFGDDPQVGAVVHGILDESWLVYESYTAPLGVGFMVRPGGHYGPDVDGYEYTPWGTYHFADRDGIGVDRTMATGTGYTGQYPEPWRSTYESLADCPDEVLLFFHHVPYGHVLRSGKTVIQHIYDSHFAGVEAVAKMVAAWESLSGRIDQPVFERGRERFAEQLRSATEWRDQVNTYFFRKSGIPDSAGRTIF